MPRYTLMLILGILAPTLGCSTQAKLAVDSKGLFLVRPEQAGSFELVTHELAHLAAGRKQYGEGWKKQISLAPDEEWNPNWIDLDGLVAFWGINEADAVLTTRAAALHTSKGRQGLEELWKYRLPEDIRDGGRRVKGGRSILRGSDGRTITVRRTAHATA